MQASGKVIHYADGKPRREDRAYCGARMLDPLAASSDTNSVTCKECRAKLKVEFDV